MGVCFFPGAAGVDAAVGEGDREPGVADSSEESCSSDSRSVLEFVSLVGWGVSGCGRVLFSPTSRPSSSSGVTESSPDSLVCEGEEGAES